MIENPIIKEPAAQLTIPYLDMVSEREKIIGIERFIKLWEEAERREKSGRSREVSADSSILDQRSS